jgi:hypothetical protein
MKPMSSDQKSVIRMLIISIGILIGISKKMSSDQKSIICILIILIGISIGGTMDYNDQVSYQSTQGQ